MTPPRSAPRVVAAVASDLRPRLRAILPDCALCFVSSGSELVRALDEAPCVMMLVAVRYDRAGAVAALRFVLSRDERFPVVCVRDLPSDEPTPAVLNGLRRALGAAVAGHFVDLAAHGDDEAGNARVRATLERLLMSLPQG
jgi:hypothetical protein